MLLAAAAVRPRGVVLALAAQFPLVEHAAVGVQVALAPETQETAADDGDNNRHRTNQYPAGWIHYSFFFLPNLAVFIFAFEMYFYLFMYFFSPSTRLDWNPGGLSDWKPSLHKASLCSPLTKQGLICICPCGENDECEWRHSESRKERHSVRFTNWGQNRDVIEMMAQRERRRSRRILFLLPSKFAVLPGEGALGAGRRSGFIRRTDRLGWRQRRK